MYGWNHPATKRVIKLNNINDPWRAQAWFRLWTLKVTLQVKTLVMSHPYLLLFILNSQICIWIVRKREMKAQPWTSDLLPSFCLKSYDLKFQLSRQRKTKQPNHIQKNIWTINKGFSNGNLTVKLRRSLASHDIRNLIQMENIF